MEQCDNAIKPMAPSHQPSVVTGLTSSSTLEGCEHSGNSGSQTAETERLADLIQPAVFRPDAHAHVEIPSPECEDLQICGGVEVNDSKIICGRGKMRRLEAPIVEVHETTSSRNMNVDSSKEQRPTSRDVQTRSDDQSKIPRLDWKHQVAQALELLKGRVGKNKESFMYVCSHL